MSKRSVSELLEVRLKAAHGELERVKVSLAEERARRADDLVIPVDSPLYVPVRELLHELRIVADAADPLPGRPEGGSRSAESALPHEASAVHRGWEREVVERVQGLRRALVLRRGGEWDESTRVRDPVTGARRKPATRVSFAGSLEEPPVGWGGGVLLRMDLGRWYSVAEVHGDLPEGRPDVARLRRWFTWMVQNGYLEADVGADGPVYRRIAS